MSVKPQKPIVVLIDDDKFWASTAIRHLDERFSVVYIEESDKVIGYFSDNYDYDAVVLDIMMPSPDGAAGETEDGFMTGIWILEQIEGFVIAAKIPVVILSNHSDLPRIEELVQDMHKLRRFVTVQSKYNTRRAELPPFIESKIHEVKAAS